MHLLISDILFLLYLQNMINFVQVRNNLYMYKSTLSILVYKRVHTVYTNIVVKGFFVFFIFCFMYIFDNIQVKMYYFTQARFFIWGALELITRSGIAPLLGHLDQFKGPSWGQFFNK